MSRQLQLLSVVALGYWATSHMIRPVVTMFLASLGASPMTIGVVVAIQNFVPLLLAIPAGRLADRFGCRRLLLLGSLGMIGAAGFYISTAATHGYATLVAAQVLEGVSELLLWTSAQAYVTQLGSERDSDSNIGYFSLFSAAGQVAGPALAGIATDRWGYQAAFWIFAAMCVALLANILPLPEHRMSPAARAKTGVLSASMRICANAEVQVSMISTFASLFITGIWTSFYPVYMISTGLTASAAGLLVSIKGLASVAARFLLKPVARKLGRSGGLLLATAVALVAVAVTPLLHSFTLLAVAAVASGIGLGLNMPLTISIMAHNTCPDERGIAMGLRLVMNRVALMTNPLVFGVVSEYAGSGLSFYASSAVVAILMAVAAVRWRLAGLVNTRGSARLL